MASGTSSLATTVSFLEAVLVAVGHEPVVNASLATREALRERFRASSRLLKRLMAELDARQQAEQGAWRIPSAVAIVPIAHMVAIRWPDRRIIFSHSHLAENCFTLSTPPVLEALARVCADYVPTRFRGSLVAFDVLAMPTPIFAKAPPTIFDVATRVAVDGITCVYAAVMDLWSRRHDVVASATSSKQQPQRRLALDRLFLALMRFAFGFFGSHKVDSRNNP